MARNLLPISFISVSAQDDLGPHKGEQEKRLEEERGQVIRMAGIVVWFSFCLTFIYMNFICICGVSESGLASLQYGLMIDHST